MAVRTVAVETNRGRTEKWCWLRDVTIAKIRVSRNAEGTELVAEAMSRKTIQSSFTE
eukprot:jgi/Psemu1/307520/fgenesh1_kg.336_\